MDEERFAVEVLQRRPSAESVRRVWKAALAEDFVQDVWDRHRGRCYDRVPSFPEPVRLVGECLIEHGGSGRNGLERAARRGDLPVAVAAGYEKLRRIPPAVSEAFLREGTQRLSGLRLRARRCRPASTGGGCSRRTARCSSTSGVCSSRCAPCRRGSGGAGLRVARRA